MNKKVGGMYCVNISAFEYHFWLVIKMSLPLLAVTRIISGCVQKGPKKTRNSDTNIVIIAIVVIVT